MTIQEEEGRLVLTYDLTQQEIYAGLKTVDQKKNMRRRIVLSTLTAILTVIFVRDFIVEPTYYQGLLLAILSAVLTVVLWVIPGLSLKSTAKAMFQYGAELTLTVSQQSMIFTQGNAVYKIDPEKISFAARTATHIVMEYKKQMVFVIPLDGLTEEQITTIHNRLSANPMADDEGKESETH